MSAESGGALARSGPLLVHAARTLTAAGGPLDRDLAALGWTGEAAGAAAAAAHRIAARGTDLSDGAVALAQVVASVAAGSWDEAADHALAAALDGTAPHAPPAPPPSPPPGVDPRAVASWWSGLDPGARDALVHDRPDLVGGLDGVPAADRDRANRSRLAAARRDADADERAALTDVLDAHWIGDLARAVWRLSRAHARLGRLTAVDAAVAAPDRRLLALDEDGDHGGHTRAAVACGDVDTAAHVGVFTPGFTTGVADLSGRLDELEAVRAAAGPDTATVAWYDYDAPQWDGVLEPDRSVLGERSAQVGAARLRGFLDGLDAARPAGRAPAHVTAIGHSYGSVTTALATAPGAADGVDDVVVLGSPGIGPRPTRAPGHEYAIEAPDDPVARADWFGPDPARMPGVVGLSARPVVLPDGRVLRGSRGHGEYLAPGSTSAHDVAAVVAGRPGDAVPAPHSPAAGERLRSLVGGR